MDMKKRMKIPRLSFDGKLIIILNVDETWLGMSDFRKMKWFDKKETNSHPALII